MKIYRFSLGNSETGPVGACVEVKAKDKKEALSLVQDFLGMLDSMEIPILEDLSEENPSRRQDKRKAIHSAHVNFNYKAITESDIEEARAEG